MDNAHSQLEPDIVAISHSLQKEVIWRSRYLAI